MINNLPIELIDIIYQFDGRYRSQYNTCIKEIDDIYDIRLLNLSVLNSNNLNFRTREWVTIHSPVHKYILWKCKTTKKKFIIMK